MIQLDKKIIQQASEKARKNMLAKFKNMNFREQNRWQVFWEAIPFKPLNKKDEFLEEKRKRGRPRKSS